MCIPCMAGKASCERRRVDAWQLERPKQPCTRARHGGETMVARPNEGRTQKTPGRPQKNLQAPEPGHDLWRGLQPPRLLFPCPCARYRFPQRCGRAFDVHVDHSETTTLAGHQVIDTNLPPDPLELSLSKALRQWIQQHESAAQALQVQGQATSTFRFTGLRGISSLARSAVLS